MSELTVTEFVTARLDEDEERARSAVSALSELDHWAAVASDVIAMRRFEVGAHVAQWGPARVLAQCAAMRKIVELVSAPVDLGNWRPDCGGDYCLGGATYFANYWPDNTVSASIYSGRDDEGQLDRELADSGIITGDSRADCQAKAEAWIRANITAASPTIRALASIWSDHPDWREEWR